VLPDSESAIGFAIGSTVPPFWVFPGWHFARSDRNGPVWLVNVVNGSVGTVTSRHHTGHRGEPAIVTSHNVRYLVKPQQMHELQTIAIDDPLAQASVSPSVCCEPSGCVAERIGVLFEV